MACMTTDEIRNYLVMRGWDRAAVWSAPDSFVRSAFDVSYPHLSAMDYPELVENLKQQEMGVDATIPPSWMMTPQMIITPPEKPAEPSSAEKPIHECTLEDYRRGIERMWMKGWG